VERPGGSKSKGNDSHVRIYEVAHLPARGQLDRPADRLSFSADGTELAAGDTVWRVNHIGGRPRLAWSARVPGSRTTFFDVGGRRWSMLLRDTLKPDTPITLEQIRPESRTVSFPGRPHRGFDG
jgi:hypothetical protein